MIISGSDFVMFFHQKLPFLSNRPCLVQNRSAPAQNSLSALKYTVACRNVSCFILGSCTQIHCCLQKCPVFQFKFSRSSSSARSRYLSLSLNCSLSFSFSLRW